jgi:hypothetical protein
VNSALALALGAKVGDQLRFAALRPTKKASS